MSHLLICPVCKKKTRGESYYRLHFLNCPELTPEKKKELEAWQEKREKDLTRLRRIWEETR